MIRRSPRHKGVFQRCAATCPADRCRTHSWSYEIELPAGAGGQRPRFTKAGFATAKDAAAARSEIERQHREGTLPTDHNKTVGLWLPEWLQAKIERKELRGNTARGYKDHIEDYLVPTLGHHRLTELRGIDISRAYVQIMRERREAIAAAQARNGELAAEAEQVNAGRRSAGKRRMMKAQRVPVLKPLGPVTIHRIHVVLSGALESAVKAQLATRNVALDAELPKAPRRKVKPPTVEDFRGFLDGLEADYQLLIELVSSGRLGTWEERRRAITGRMYPVIVLAGYTGLRRGELAGLRWSDMDLTARLIVVAQQHVPDGGYEVAVREPKTEAGEDRAVWLDPDTIMAMKTWQIVQNAERLAFDADYQDGGYVFARETGKPFHPEYLSKTFTKLAKKAGLPPKTTLHTLRHFWASALISSGADIAAVSKALGHKTINVTSDIYGSLFRQGGQEMAAKAAALVGAHPHAAPIDN